MRNLYASTLHHLVLGLCFVIPVSANAALTCNSITGPASRVLAAQCAQCHGSSGEDMGSYIPSTGGEGPQVMHWQLQGYSDAQRCAIANCYKDPTTCASTVGGGGQTPPPPPPGLQAQTLTFVVKPNSIIFAQTGTVLATSTSGLTPTYSSATPLICSISGTTVSVVDVSADPCKIVAKQSGNTIYSPASLTASIIISKAGQTLILSAPTSIRVGQTGTVSATGGNSGNPVTLSSTTTSICTISGTTVTGRAVGTCTIAANQAGNGNYNAAIVTQDINISRRRRTGG